MLLFCKPLLLNKYDLKRIEFSLSTNKFDLGKHTIDKSQLQLVNPDDLNAYYPGILLPYRDKDEFTMPVPHLVAMENYIGNVETLVIIGWKGNEEAFNRTLIRRGTAIKKIIIVDPNSEVPASNLKELIESRNITPIYYKTFEDFFYVHGSCTCVFLSIYFIS